MSSAGFRVLLGVMKGARKNGGDLRLSRVQGNVEAVLEKGGFSRFMLLFRDLDLAVDSFTQ